MKVSSIMSQPAVTIRPDASLADAARLMIDRKIGSLPVVDGDGKLLGIITESSFTAKTKGIPFSTFRAPQVLGHWLTLEGLEKIYDAAREMRVEEIMRERVATVGEDEPVARAVQLMLDHDVNRLPVIGNGAVVGVVARHDLLRLMLSAS